MTVFVVRERLAVPYSGYGWGKLAFHFGEFGFHDVTGFAGYIYGVKVKLDGDIFWRRMKCLTFKGVNRKQLPAPSGHYDQGSHAEFGEFGVVAKKGSSPCAQIRERQGHRAHELGRIERFRLYRSGLLRRKCA